MKYLQETTDWGNHNVPNHIYYVNDSKTKMVGYIKAGSKSLFKFSKPMTIDVRGRKFVELKKNPFKVKAESNLIQVTGSKGDTYFVDPDNKTCTCSGFQFRGRCKHIDSVLK